MAFVHCFPGTPCNQLHAVQCYGVNPDPPLSCCIRVTASALEVVGKYWANWWRRVIGRTPTQGDESKSDSRALTTHATIVVPKAGVRSETSPREQHHSVVLITTAGSAESSVNDNDPIRRVIGQCHT